MEEGSIKNLAELDESYLEHAVRLFVKSFLQETGYLASFDTSVLVRAIKHSFLKDHYYAALQDDQVMGIVALSTSRGGRSHVLNPKQLRSELGPIKGQMIHAILRNELEKPMVLTDRQCYVESVTTAQEARGKGVATRLMRHLFDTLDYDEYILEVVDTNVKAIQLYERLGFAIFERKKAGFFLRRMGINERLYMRKMTAT